MRRSLVLALSLMTLAGAGLGAARAQPPPPPAAPRLLTIEGEDQHDRAMEPERYAGRPLLLLWGDRKGSEFMLAWSRALADAPADPTAAAPARLDVAHTRGAPFFVKGRIKKRFRRDWSEPVLMDWDGRFARTYDCAEDSCTVLLFGADGRLTGRWTVAEVEPAVLAEIRRAAGHGRER